MSTSSTFAIGGYSSLQARNQKHTLNTDSALDPLAAPYDADMMVVPAALPAVASPLASMVASNVLLDAQATVLVQFVVVLSLQ